MTRCHPHPYLRKVVVGAFVGMCCVHLSVHMFICAQDNSKGCGQIEGKFSGQVHIGLTKNWLNFGPPNLLKRSPIMEQTFRST